jgi:hypothetical protein
MVAADLWLPTQVNPNGNERKNDTYGIVARLKPGVTMAQARAEMVMIGQRLEQQYPATNSGWGVRVFPMAEMYSGKIRPVLLVLLGAVGLLLLIACADLANLLLARAAARQKEIAIRGAMGVGRMRIVRQLMTEGLVLAFPDDLVGLMLAAVSVRLLRGVIPDMFPTMKQMTFDWPVLLFTFGICILTCLLFGLVPALKVSRVELNTTLKEAGGRSDSAGGSQRIRGTLLASEVALAVLLSVSAGLLMRSFVRVMSVNPGLRTENILTMNISLPEVKYPTPRQRLTFFKTLMERLQASPGVRSAGAVQFLPLRVSILSVRIGVSGFQTQGHPALPDILSVGSEPKTEAITVGGDMRVLKPVFVTVVCAFVIAAAAHTQQKQSSDSEYIAQALSAAPEAVGKGATVVRMQADGSMRTLREGKNEFTCMIMGTDKMCNDPNSMEFINAVMKHTPPPDKVGISYMFAGDHGASNTDPYAMGKTADNHWIVTGPHIMVLGPQARHWVTRRLRTLTPINRI